MKRHVGAPGVNVAHEGTSAARHDVKGKPRVLHARAGLTTFLVNGHQLPRGCNKQGQIRLHPGRQLVRRCSTQRDDRRLWPREAVEHTSSCAQNVAPRKHREKRLRKEEVEQVKQMTHGTLNWVHSLRVRRRECDGHVRQLGPKGQKQVGRQSALPMPICR